jgi:hypothetical protein
VPVERRNGRAVRLTVPAAGFVIYEQPPDRAEQPTASQ